MFDKMQNAYTNPSFCENMTIQQIIADIGSFMGSDNCNPLWLNALTNDPEAVFCSVDDLNCNVKNMNVWVNVPDRTFSFNEADLSFSYRTGASSDAERRKVTDAVSGFGTFVFSSGSAIEVTGLSLNGRIKVE
jgi:hypothetical protein